MINSLGLVVARLPKQEAFIPQRIWVIYYGHQRLGARCVGRVGHLNGVAALSA